VTQGTQGARLRVSVGAASHTGLVRERNEDSALRIQDLFAVADGMGGHAAGDVASRLAIAALMRLGGRDDIARRGGQHDIAPDEVVAAIAAANHDILAAIETDQRQAGMGTTLTGLAIVDRSSDPRWLVFNVGDSRVYRFADDELTQVTVDHSEVVELVAAGRLSADEAKQYPRRNVVTRSLGLVPAPAADVWVLAPAAPERFLVCSDGLTLELSDDSIADVLRAEADPQRAADRLVAVTLDAGGRDNVTVVVVDSD
jgi:serine/threonine protein phosphatase PrpC